MSDGLQKIVLLHTNDIHSHFEQMPKIASAFDRLRRKHEGSRVVTIDCGDHMDRSRMETEGTDGMANVAVMNESGYEFAAIGNNEGLTLSPDALAAAYGSLAEFAVVGGNLADSRTGEPPDWMHPCRIIESDGVRVAFIGATACFPDFYSLLGWDVGEPFAAVAASAALAREQADIVVLLSHLGLKIDEAIAEQIAGVDVILGAHTHHLLEEPVRFGHSYICAAGKFGQHVGEVELYVDRATGRLAHVTGRCHPVDREPHDERVARVVADYGETSALRLGRELAVIDRPLPADHRSESPLGNLLASGLRRWTGAEIGLVNAGQLLDGLPAGAVTAGRLLQLCPSPINPCLMSLRGDLLLRALDESLQEPFIEMPIKGFGFRGRVLGTLAVDGLRIEWAPNAGSHAKIRRVYVNGEWLQEDREYSVGTIDMFTFGVGYRSIAAGRRVRFYLPEFLRDVLARQLSDRGEVESSFVRRWFDLTEGASARL